jgi:undecaprenyl-diphosphatase
MTFIQSIIYGIIQGLTEFIPISSTAHIRIVPALLGWNDPGAAFTAVTQIGTLIAVLVYFRKDIVRLVGASITSLAHGKLMETEDARTAWWLVIGSIPIMAAGYLFKDIIETSLRSLYVIAATLIALAVVLMAAEYAAKHQRELTGIKAVDAIVVGIAQALALIPGASRSGVTITAGLFLNFKREAAARFSFLLSIPAVLVSGLYQLYKMRSVIAGEFGIDLLIAIVVSGVVGYLSIEFLLRYLRSRSTWLFIWYRIGLGIIIILLLVSGKLVS